MKHVLTTTVYRFIFFEAMFATPNEYICFLNTIACPDLFCNIKQIYFEILTNLLKQNTFIFKIYDKFAIFLVAVFYGPNVITQTDQYNLILPTLISILTRLYNNNINEDDVGYIYHHTLRKVVECKNKTSSTLQFLSF